jgi:hypothetical protein
MDRIMKVAPCAAFYCGTLLCLKEPHGPGGAAKADIFNEGASRHRSAGRVLRRIFSMFSGNRKPSQKLKQFRGRWRAGHDVEWTPKA